MIAEEIKNMIQTHINSPEGISIDKMRAIKKELDTAYQKIFTTMRDGIQKTSVLEQMKSTQITKGTKEQIIESLKNLEDFQVKMQEGMELGVTAIEQARDLFLKEIIYHIAIEDGVGGFLYSGDFTFSELQELGMLAFKFTSKSSITNFGTLQIRADQTTIDNLILDGKLKNTAFSRDSLKAHLVQKYSIGDNIIQDKRWNAGWAWQFLRGFQINENNYNPEYENASYTAASDIDQEQDKLLTYFRGRATVRISSLHSILIGLQTYSNCLSQILTNGTNNFISRINDIPSDNQIIEKITNNLFKSLGMS